MYVDGVILLGFYVMLVIALLVCGINYIEIQELKQRLNRKPKSMPQPRQTIKTTPRAKGHWD